MTDFKEKHYWTQVQAALLAGHWDSLEPGKTPNGSFLSWSELFRKAKKHSKQSDVPEAASQTHYLSLLLSSTAQISKELDGSEIVEIDPFSLGNECILVEERREEVQKAYEALQLLKSSDEFVKQSMAFLAYALNRPSECLEHVSGVVFASKLTSIYPAFSVTSSGEKADNPSISSMLLLPKEIEDQDAWILMEALQGFCLEGTSGMAHERVSPGSPSQAFVSYDKGVSLLGAFAIPKSPPPRPGRAISESFNNYRELWRWTERLLWRAIMLSARHRSIESIIPLFRIYSSHSVHWTPKFQPTHRSTHTTLFQNKAVWTSEIRSVVHEYRAILTATTPFPSAGERNVLVEEFVDLYVAAWEAGGSIGDQATWVLDILWWATRLTFNSPRILRHMARLLHVTGDNTLAVRVVRLYVQIVRKSRETGTMNAQGEDTHGAGATERDALWVATFLQGARMLCRMQGGVREIREAEEFIGLARERIGSVSDELIASVDLADGICKSMLAIRAHEPAERGPLLSKSVDLLIRSVEKYPTASSCFHAAIALSRPIPERDLERAVDLCRRAVETEPRDVRHWHLLALLEAKLGEWKKAHGLVEVALAIAEDVERRVQMDEMREDAVLPRDYGVGDGERTPTLPRIIENGEINDMNDSTEILPTRTLVDPDARRLPPASSLLQPLPDHPPATSRELFEHALRLRMTQIALTELIEGPESVEACWLEVFDWYSQRRDTVAQARSARPSTEVLHTPSPAYLENDVQESLQTQSDVTENSSGLTISNGHSTAESSLDVATVRSPMRTSLDRSAETSVMDSTRPASPSTRMKNKERTSGESQYTERDKKGKRVQQMLKDQVHKQSARINTISKKDWPRRHKEQYQLASLQLCSRNLLLLLDLNAILARAMPYQASSIHSRRRLSFGSRVPRSERNRDGSPAAPSPPPPLPQAAQENMHDVRNARERRLLSDLWLMSAATFRRLEKLDQTRGAIQEAEALDEENEAVWVQLGLYFSARGEEGRAIEAFHKALFIAQDSVSATLHLSQLYLTSHAPFLRSSTYGAVDLAAGMLEALTRGPGWDVAEAWYLLAKAYRMQGRAERERECLVFALGLAEVRGVYDIGVAIGWCL
ncbi:hypothetical protein EW145_g4227 [Phellinidium pouzarii]|uniref:TPR-like protein n=1 Tax=Phellinidium pouzarii TaxID=167371 RepID=A0A4S4L5Q5_9AGAM|nr:hypothetical protein EW145_g4227 [Phellinidium pouzarii]